MQLVKTFAHLDWDSCLLFNSTTAKHWNWSANFSWQGRFCKNRIEQFSHCRYPRHSRVRFLCRLYRASRFGVSGLASTLACHSFRRKNVETRWCIVFLHSMHWTSSTIMWNTEIYWWTSYWLSCATFGCVLSTNFLLIFDNQCSWTCCLVFKDNVYIPCLCRHKNFWSTSPVIWSSRREVGGVGKLWERLMDLVRGDIVLRKETTECRRVVLLPWWWQDFVVKGGKIWKDSSVCIFNSSPVVEDSCSCQEIVHVDG